MATAREPHPSDVPDEERALVAPHPTLLPEDAGRREHPLREVFDGLRHVVETGAPWRWMPHDLPPSRSDPPEGQAAGRHEGAASCSCPAGRRRRPGVAERTFAWATRFRRLVRDRERWPQTLADLHVVALACLRLRQAANFATVHDSLSCTVRSCRIR